MRAFRRAAINWIKCSLLLSMAHLWISLLINRISVSAPDPEREAGDMIYVGPGLGCSDPIFPRFLPSCVQSQVSSSRPIASSSWCWVAWADHFVLLPHSAIFPAPLHNAPGVKLQPGLATVSVYSNSTNNLIATSQVFLMINVRVACRSLAAPLIKLPELDHSALCATFPPVFLSPVAKIQSSSDDGAQGRAAWAPRG